MNTTLLSVLLLMVTLTIVGATSIDEFQLDVDDVEIYQTCNNCTSCNFTRVMGPNNQSILSNLTAIKDGDYYFSVIDKGNFTEVGDYSYIYVCGNAAEKKTGRLTFEITYTGGKLTGQVVTICLMSIFMLIFILALIVLLITRLPTKDSTDEAGTILEISNLKHLRPVLWGAVWGIILGLMFIISNITIAYLPTAMIGGLFWAIYSIMFWITLPGIIVWFIWIFTRIFKDKEFKRMIDRGVEVNSL